MCLSDLGDEVCDHCDCNSFFFYDYYHLNDANVTTIWNVNINMLNGFNFN